MKVVGLITEYNPFHNGHLYHIEKAKEITGADHVLVVMSGSFVQRGAPALMPKHMRAEMALLAGASVVIELPVCFSCQSAEYFAAGAISLLDGLNCVDTVCFGSECGNKEFLSRVAQTMSDEPEEYKLCLRQRLKEGVSFPLARYEALKSVLKDECLSALLKYPNNILGIEYIKALISQKSRMDFCTIKRIDSGYHDETLKEGICSASAIRSMFTASVPPAPDCLEGKVPSFCITPLKREYLRRYPVCDDDLSLLLKYKLLFEDTHSLTGYMDVTEELANRIINNISGFITFSQFCSLLKTKDITYTRISRCLIHILLNITGRDVASFKDEGYCQYARILGLRKDKTGLLSLMKRKSRIPLVTKPARTGNLSRTGLRMLSMDITAADLYESIITDKFKTPFISDFCHQIVF